MLIDSHAHLDAPYFRNRLPAVLDRAKKAGVERIITIGVTPSSSRNCMKIVEKYPLVFAAAGYHPHWAKGSDPDLLALAERIAAEPSVVALGEVGLDYHHFHSPKQDQIRLFRHMLEIAVAARLPVIIHDRKAHADVYEILSAFQARLSGGIIHCFSGDWDLAQKYLNWGFYLSIPGPVTYPKSDNLREVAKKTPLDRMLIETDAPHLAPAQCRGRKNEPAFIRYTAREIANLRNISLEKVADVTSQNVLHAYQFPP